jgi:hypothetical protein
MLVRIAPFPTSSIHLLYRANVFLVSYGSHDAFVSIYSAGKYNLYRQSNAQTLALKAETNVQILLYLLVTKLILVCFHSLLMTRGFPKKG